MNEQINWDIVRNEIMTELSDIEESALVIQNPEAIEEFNRLHKQLDEVYKKAEEDHWEFDW